MHRLQVLMSAAPQTAAASGRKKLARGKERSDAALGHEYQNTLGPGGAKEEADLPTGWEEVPIERLFAPLEDGRTLHQGWSPQCDKVPSPSEDVWGMLKTTSIQAGEFQPEHNKLLPSGLEPRPLIEVKEGDILITCAGPRVRCGVSCLVRQTRKRLMMSGKMYRFRVEADRTDARYVEAFLQTERARLAIDKMKTGSSDSGLNLTHDRFRQLRIPLAPLPEQRRIVAEIEKQFTRLEAGVAALRRVQANLKRYRAAVLKAACEGSLVPIEAELARVGRVPPRGVRPNAKNAASGDAAYNDAYAETGAQLLARILTERRQNWQGRGKYKEPAAPDTGKLPQRPNGWTWASVEQLGRATTGFTPPKNDASLFGGDIPFFKPSDLDVGYNVREFRDSLTEAGAEHGRVLPPLSILVTCIGATIGKTGLARVRCTTNQQINALTVPTQLVLPQFVYWCFNSPFGQRQIIDNASATTLPILNKSRFEALPIPLPPLAEQTRIVAEVERRLSVVEELAAAVSANLQRVTRLRQSILQKAFTGKLASGPLSKRF